jgi:hypothetical protein
MELIDSELMDPSFGSRLHNDEEEEELTADEVLRRLQAPML